MPSQPGEGASNPRRCDMSLVFGTHRTKGVGVANLSMCLLRRFVGARTRVIASLASAWDSPRSAASRGEHNEGPHKT